MVNIFSRTYLSSLYPFGEYICLNLLLIFNYIIYYYWIWKVFFLYMLNTSPLSDVCVCAQSLSHVQPTRFLCPWNFPCKNTGVGCHFLLQGIFLTKESNLSFLCLLHWQADSLPSHLGTPPLSDTCFATVFSQHMTCVFILWTLPFVEQKFSFWWDTIWQNFSFVYYAFGVSFLKPLNSRT